MNNSSFSENTPKVSPQQKKPNRIGMCGTQHEAYRLISTLSREVRKILDQIPSKNGIDYTDIDFSYFFSDPSHAHPDGYNITDKFVSLCQNGCLETCAHKENNTIARQIARLTGAGHRHASSIRKQYLNTRLLIQYRDKLSLAFVQSFYSPKIQNKRRKWEFVSFAQENSQANTDLAYFQDACSLMEMIRNPDFFSGDDKPFVRKFCDELWEFTHNIQAMHDDLEMRIETAEGEL